MRNNVARENPPIEIFEGTLVRLHKKLNGVDSLNAEKVAEKTGDADVLNPPIVIDFATVTSIQKDYKHGGTVVMDAKTACIVMEPLDEVLDAWCEVKRNLEQPQE
jgi:hypothetical protein